MSGLECPLKSDFLQILRFENLSVNPYSTLAFSTGAFFRSQKMQGSDFLYGFKCSRSRTLIWASLGVRFWFSKNPWYSKEVSILFAIFHNPLSSMWMGWSPWARADDFGIFGPYFGLCHSFTTSIWPSPMEFPLLNEWAGEVTKQAFVSTYIVI